MTKATAGGSPLGEFGRALRRTVPALLGSWSSDWRVVTLGERCSSNLAFTAFSWVPLHAPEVVTAEGFTEFPARPRRLRLLLDAYGWTGTIDEVLDAVEARIAVHIRDVQRLADAGAPQFGRLADSGVLTTLTNAMEQLRKDRSQFEIDP